MIICSRCATHLVPGSQVCLGCGLPLGAEATPLAAPAIAPAITPAAPPPAELPENPWRRKPATVEEATPIAEHDAAVPQAAVPEAAAPEAAPSAVVQQLPTRAPLLAFDPLPPVTETSAALQSAPVELAAEPSAIAVEPSEAPAAIRGIVHSPEQTLAVPAAYATFAEPAQPVAPYNPECGTADVVEIDFPAVLTVAPPARHVPGWNDLPAAGGAAAAPA